MVYIMIVYMFVGIPEKQNFADMLQLQHIMCIVSAVATVIWTLANKKMTKS
jgi:hypothetical protein